MVCNIKNVLMVFTLFFCVVFYTSAAEEFEIREASSGTLVVRLKPTINGFQLYRNIEEKKVTILAALESYFALFHAVQAYKEIIRHHPELRQLEAHCNQTAKAYRDRPCKQTYEYMMQAQRKAKQYLRGITGVDMFWHINDESSFTYDVGAWFKRFMTECCDDIIKLALSEKIDLDQINSFLGVFFSTCLNHHLTNIHNYLYTYHYTFTDQSNKLGINSLPFDPQVSLETNLGFLHARNQSATIKQLTKMVKDVGWLGDGNVPTAISLSDVQSYITQMISLGTMSLNSRRDVQSYLENEWLIFNQEHKNTKAAFLAQIAERMCWASEDKDVFKPIFSAQNDFYEFKRRGFNAYLEKVFACLTFPFLCYQLESET